jgi:Ca2+-binding RTX toxin-like protein
MQLIGGVDNDVLIGGVSDDTVDGGGGDDSLSEVRAPIP